MDCHLFVFDSRFITTFYRPPHRSTHVCGETRYSRVWPYTLMGHTKSLPFGVWRLSLAIHPSTLTIQSDGAFLSGYWSKRYGLARWCISKMCQVLLYREVVCQHTNWSNFRKQKKEVCFCNLYLFVWCDDGGWLIVMKDLRIFSIFNLVVHFSCEWL